MEKFTPPPQGDGWLCVVWKLFAVFGFNPLRASDCPPYANNLWSICEGEFCEPCLIACNNWITVVHFIRFLAVIAQSNRLWVVNNFRTTNTGPFTFHWRRIKTQKASNQRKVKVNCWRSKCPFQNTQDISRSLPQIKPATTTPWLVLQIVVLSSWLVRSQGWGFVKKGQPVTFILHLLSTHTGQLFHN